MDHGCATSYNERCITWYASMTGASSIFLTLVKQPHQALQDRLEAKFKDVSAYAAAAMMKPLGEGDSAVHARRSCLDNHDTLRGVFFCS